MRICLAGVVAIFLVLVVSIQPALALTTIGIPFISTGCSAFMEPLANTACTIEEFNSASAFTVSAETLDISFPLSGDSLLKGAGARVNNAGASSAGGSLTSNAVPFGPVDLAFPSISQSAIENTRAQRTYFFTDTF